MELLAEAAQQCATTDWGNTIISTASILVMPVVLWIFFKDSP